MPLSASDVVEGAKAAAAVAKLVEVLVDMLDGDTDKAQVLLNEEQVRRANRFADALEKAKFPAEFPD